MIATEPEAAKLWCPHVRFSMDSEDGNACNSVGDVSRPANFASCIASRCMMWTWTDAVRRRFHVAENEDATDEPSRPPQVPANWQWCPAEDDPAGWQEPVEDATARRPGTCGLIT